MEGLSVSAARGRARHDRDGSERRSCERNWIRRRLKRRSRRTSRRICSLDNHAGIAAQTYLQPPRSPLTRVHPVSVACQRERSPGLCSLLSNRCAAKMHAFSSAVVAHRVQLRATPVPLPWPAHRGAAQRPQGRRLTPCLARDKSQKGDDEAEPEFVELSEEQLASAVAALAAAVAEPEQGRPVEIIEDFTNFSPDPPGHRAGVRTGRGGGSATTLRRCMAHLRWRLQRPCMPRIPLLAPASPPLRVFSRLCGHHWAAQRGQEHAAERAAEAVAVDCDAQGADHSAPHPGHPLRAGLPGGCWGGCAGEHSRRRQRSVSTTASQYGTAAGHARHPAYHQPMVPRPFAVAGRVSRHAGHRDHQAQQNGGAHDGGGAAGRRGRLRRRGGMA